MRVALSCGGGGWETKRLSPEEAAAVRLDARLALTQTSSQLLRRGQRLSTGPGPTVPPAGLTQG